MHWIVLFFAGPPAQLYVNQSQPDWALPRLGADPSSGGAAAPFTCDLTHEESHFDNAHSISILYKCSDRPFFSINCVRFNLLWFKVLKSMIVTHLTTRDRKWNDLNFKNAAKDVAICMIGTILDL